MKNIICIFFLSLALLGCQKDPLPGKVEEMSIGDFFAMNIPAKFPTIVLVNKKGEVSFYNNNFVNDGDFEQIIKNRPKARADEDAAKAFEKLTVRMFNSGKITSSTIIYLTSGENIKRACELCDTADELFAKAVKALGKEKDVLLLQLN